MAIRDFKRTSNKHLGELLVERGVIDREQVAMAMAYQKEKGGLFGEILVELKFATEEDIAQALTCQYGFPYLPLANYEIDQEVINAVPEHVCRQNCLIPIDKIGKSLTLAMSNPLNRSAVEDVELLTGCTAQTFVSTSSDIKDAINKYYKKS
jgi:type IV pilus assembly protein PilB